MITFLIFLRVGKVTFLHKVAPVLIEILLRFKPNNIKFDNYDSNKP